jgi:Mg/Co/Ni transporter MgtE
VKRYLTAVGRLSAHKCNVLAEPWLLADDVSNVLSRVVTDGSAKGAEEAAALAALVTVPMRLTGNAGWAAAKTAVFGARVIASREKVSKEEFEALWKPLERAIPIASLDAPTRSKS